MSRIKMKLNTLLEIKGVSQRELSRMTDIRLASINEMCKNDTLRLTLDNLAKICDSLNCGILDILELEKD